MSSEKKKERHRSSYRPLYAAAFGSGGAIVIASAIVLVSPSVGRFLPFINIGIILVSAFVNAYALSLVRREEHEYFKKTVERERIMNDALQRAESSDKARRAIIANMSHEFRTPLNSVIGFAELLAEGETDGERAEMAHCVQRGGWELLDLVNSLVKAAELSGGEPRANAISRFTLEELATAVGAEHDKEIRAKGLHFRQEGHGSQPLRGDFEAISAVLGILVSNAVKYSDSGTIELRVRELSVNDGNKVTVECVVADQGRGMDAEAREKLFRPFEQGEDPLTKKYAGMGVGLYNAKRMTEAIRGDLRIESTIGVGTTAYLILPLEGCGERGD